MRGGPETRIRVCTEEPPAPIRDDWKMRRTGFFALAFLAVAALAIAGTVGAIAARNRDSLPVGELLRVETIPDASASPLDGHLNYVFEILGGEKRATGAEHAERFTPVFGAAFGAQDLNFMANGIITENGPIRFVRVHDRQPPIMSRLVTAIGVAENGTTGSILIATAADDARIDGFVINDHPGNPRRFRAWESSLTLLAAWFLFAAAAVAWRHRAAREAWTLLAAAVPSLAGLLVLSNTSASYTAGRAIPSLVLVFAAALLLGPKSSRWQLWIAGAAAVVGVSAPFVRDSELIGHPQILGAFTDNETIYQTLLVSAAGLTVVAMGGVAAANLTRVQRVGVNMRPALWAAASIAAVWAIAAVGAAVDYGTGDGTLAEGPFRVVTLVALALVPAVVLLRFITSSWDRPELATLVIDLESEGGADLQPAVARALEDPTLQVVTSPDGHVLLNDDGERFSPDALPDGQALTRIQTGGRLIGGLVHTSDLQRNPDRLEAVAAAAGMALEVNRLNLQVLAQLDEVDASRARILEASDTARRRVERDLHDGAQQRLVALGLRLQRARRLAGSEGRDDLATLLEESTREVRDTIEEIRAVSRGGQPALLAERGLATAVDALAERAPVPVQIDITTDPLPSRVEKTAYYVIAEGLTNMAKYALATNAHVSITRRNGVACITIRDDGKGGAKIAAGSGLEGLNDRVAATGGTFNVSSDPGGTTLEATIPCR